MQTAKDQNGFLANLFKIHNTCIPELSKHDIYNPLLRPNIKISVFQITSLKILGRVGTHIFFFFFMEKCNFMHFERHFDFQNA